MKDIVEVRERIFREASKEDRLFDLAEDLWTFVGD
ncbi:TPA_asm: hypothetical protein vir519_00060 [Caudoviricetes sp. vir519]|nr:TPA_asm: hypothetical protein vir519_00060 [Caudoviricetes sp. vir519]